jgi:tetratricopeptide (TPR) repeat protein
LFVLALLSKAVAVTLPAVLLILDVSPLRRLGPGNWRRSRARQVWLEKIPFFATSIVFLVIALLAKQSNASVAAIRSHGLPGRLILSCYGVAFYLAKTVWPVGLAAHYPLPGAEARLFTIPYLFGIPLVVAFTVIVVLLRRRCPGLLACWVAFLVVLAPNVGLLRIGNQIAADRYSYLTSISLVIPMAFGITWLIRAARSYRGGFTTLVGVMLILAWILAGLSWRTCRNWYDAEALWANVYRQGYRDNATVLVHMGMAAEQRGQSATAKEFYNAAIRDCPSFADSYNLLGSVLDREGRIDEAEAYYQKAMRLAPDYPSAQNNLGSVLARRGQFPSAIARFSEAVRLKPDFALARKNLAKALMRTGQLRRALVEFAEVTRLLPDDGGLRNDFGRALVEAGRLGEAISRFEEAARLDPQSAAARINWGLALEQSGRFEESLGHFAEAVRLEPNRIDNHLLLATALQRRGKLHEAASEFQTVLRLDPGNRDARESLRDLRAKIGP